MSILDSLPSKRREQYQVEDTVLHLNEMSLSQQMKWNEFYKENEGNHEKLYSFLLVMCCDEFKDEDPQEVADRLPAKLLLDLGQKIIDLCGLGEEEEEKKD